MGKTRKEEVQKVLIQRQATSAQHQASHKCYIWGSGKDGRCGNGKQSSENTPFDLNGLMLKVVKSGYHHTAGITRDGVLISWG